MTEPAGISNSPPTLQAGQALLLEVQALSKRFGGLQAVKDLSFTLAEGEIVALIGPNGAGKTTAFALLSGFLTPDTGRVWLRGRELHGLEPHEVNRLGLARTFQIMRPFPRLSVLRNVMIATLGRHPRPSEAAARARAILTELDLAAKAELLAAGLTLAERKRLELARALGTEPSLLLLDEVMSGLTEAETERIVELVRTINRRGVAILLIEHVMRAVMSLAQRIIVLNYGERIAEGPPDVVARDPRVVEAYLGDEDVSRALA
jgi:branched-chain amino acid transport system ATP-binding protein